MQFAVTFRHMDATEALKEYAREKVERINKYFADPIKAHVVMSVDRAIHHHVDVVITLRSGFVIKGEESTEDMYSSIDLVMAKIERQVRRYKEKLQQHRRAADHDFREMSHAVVSLNESAPVATDLGEAEPAPQHKVILKEKFVAQPLSVDDAILQLNLSHNDFLVFLRAETRTVNVVYRRKDATYGLIETGNGGAAKA